MPIQRAVASAFNPNPGAASLADKGTILFVDHEPFILGALERCLKSEQDRWDARFATSAREASVQLAHRPADIVVSGMALPDSDGISFLEAIQRDFPASTRIVLSGECTRGVLDRAHTVAHMVLSKPWSRSELVRTLGSALALHHLLERRGMPEAVAELSADPIRTPAYGEFVSSHQGRAGTGARLAADLIGQRAALCRRLVAIVNAGLLGTTPLAGSLEDAIRVFGIDTISSLILALEVYSSRLPSGELHARAERHALVTATVAASMVRGTHVACAFTAGLLHDLGSLYWDDPPEAEDADESAPDAVDHAAIGAYLLATWGLPQPVVEAVIYHHHPRWHPAWRTHRTADATAVAAVHVADNLSYRVEGRSAPELSPDVLEVLGLGTDLSDLHDLHDLTDQLSSRYDARNSAHSAHSRAMARWVKRVK